MGRGIGGIEIAGSNRFLRGKIRKVPTGYEVDCSRNYKPPHGNVFFEIFRL